MAELQLAHTGDGSSRTPVSDAILYGYAKTGRNAEGELYTFLTYPQVSLDELKSFENLPYADIFYRITHKYLHDALPASELRKIADEAYSTELFDFTNSQINITKISPEQYLAGLSDGPTGAFKDMAMQPFARWVEAIRQSKNIKTKLTILLSTSGDTGPAALSAFAGRNNIQLICMFPADNVSAFQRAQMVGAHDGKNIHVLQVDSDFSGINRIHMAANEQFDLGAVNSVNIARIIAQIPYHFAAYLHVIKDQNGKIGDPVDVSIPSGNFGNALSAIVARQMGLPIRRIILATNENDTLVKFFDDAVFAPAAQAVHTDSNAQDITMPSNLWRYLAMLFDNDGNKIAEIYDQLGSKKSVDMNNFKINKPEFIKDIKAIKVISENRHLVMKNLAQESNGELLIDPHTANAVYAAIRAKSDKTPVIVYQTAQAFKFADSVQKVTGKSPKLPARFAQVVASASGKQIPHMKNQADVIEYLNKIVVR